MFKEILRTEWNWSRYAVVVTVVAAFALPLVAIQPTGMESQSLYDTTAIMNVMRRYSPWFGGLAMLLGLVFATTTWGADHRGHHVYALTLPVPRWQYVVMRYSAGLLLLCAPLAAMWFGCLVASAAAQIPTGLQAYPYALSLRFAFATVLAFSVFFAISAGTTRTAAYVLTVLLVVGLGQVGINVFGLDRNVIGWILDSLVVWPGPLEIFTGEWMLIDV